MKAPAGAFEAANAESLLEADTTHWWFRGKAEAVNGLLRRWAPAGGWLVDVGAGSGGVTAMLAWPTERTLVVEGSAVLAGTAAARGLRAVRADALRLPVPDGAAAVVCFLDVIEHLADPVAALAEAARAVAPGGLVVVNVPAHAWLWSATDVALGHQRRYRRPLLRSQLAEAGLRPVWASHVFSWCVGPALVARRLVRSGEAALGTGPTGPLVHRLAGTLNGAERRLLGRATLPLGTSLLAAAVPQPDRSSSAARRYATAPAMSMESA